MVRMLVGGAGLLLGTYGAWLLLSREDDLLAVAVWLTVGVLLHDAVLAPLVLLAGLALLRWAPAALRGPAVVGAVVLGSVTLLAVPVLGRFGAKSDNPTLLDRNYVAGWAVLAALVVIGVVAAWLVVRSRHGRRTGASGREGG